MINQIPDFNSNDVELYGFSGLWGVLAPDKEPIDTKDKDESLVVL